MTTSNQLDSFLRTGKHPATAKETSAVLDLLRSRILTNNETKPMTTITASLTAEFMTWKRTHPEGTALQFVESRNGTGKTPAPGAGLDPKNLPRMATGKIDSLAVTNLLQRQKAHELKIASAAVSRKNPPRKSFVGKQSRYYQPD
jgi:hypothetical protein